MFLLSKIKPTQGYTFAHLLKKENNNLDLLRIILAFFVIYSHAFVISPPLLSKDYEFLISLTGLNYVSFGGVAVKTFFLISGVLVTNSLMSEKIFLTTLFQER